MFFTLLLLGAGLTVVGCADEYVGYPGYRGGYYAGYSGYNPYYGYGYAPYPYYGPYYGGPYYGGPYYGGGGAVVLSSSRNYVYRDAYRNRTYTYRDRFGRFHRTDRVRTRRTTGSNANRTAPATHTQKDAARTQNDDEQRYYAPR